MPPAWHCASSPYRDQHHTKVTPAPGRGGSPCKPCPPTKASQGTHRQSTAGQCYCISGKHGACLNSSSRWPQTGPLTTQRPSPSHNRQREPLQKMALKANAASAIIVGHRQQTQETHQKCRVLVNRGHCPVGHHRIFSSQGYYFQEQEMYLTCQTQRNGGRAIQNKETKEYVSNERKQNHSKTTM